MDRLDAVFKLPGIGGGSLGVIRRVLGKRHGVLVAVIEKRICAVDRVGQLFGVAQQVEPGADFLILPCFQFGLFELINAIAQPIAQALFFLLVQSQRVDLITQRTEAAVDSGKSPPKLFGNAEAVEIGKMSLFIHQLPAVVLSVDVHQHRGKLPELHGADRNAANAAGALSVRADAALQDQFIIDVDLVVAQEALQLRVQIERGRHNGPFRSAADKLAADTVAKHGADRVDHNGFARARLARQNVQAGSKADIGPLDHGYIFNVELVEHKATSFKSRAIPARHAHFPPMMLSSSW